jgi:hypothetical protein
MNQTAVQGVFAHKKATPFDKLFAQLALIWKIALVITSVVWFASFIGLFIIVG